MNENRDPNRRDVVADDGEHLHIANAMYLWECGEFSEWVERHGLPLTIDGVEFAETATCEEELHEFWDAVENALANFPRGPYDPSELAD